MSAVQRIVSVTASAAASTADITLTLQNDWVSSWLGSLVIIQLSIERIAINYSLRYENEKFGSQQKLPPYREIFFSSSSGSRTQSLAPI